MPEKISFDSGMQAAALDPVIVAARDRLEKVVSDVERIRGTLEPHLDQVRERLTKALSQPGAVDDARLMTSATRMIDWLEKYARTALTLTKTLDEIARLRSLMAGGSESRPDLSSLSDSELARYILDQREVAKAVSEKKE